MKIPSIETRSVVAVTSTALFIAAYILPWFFPMPKGTENYMGQMQGAIITQWVSVMQWYFGSSKSASDTRAQIGQALNKVPDANQ